MSLQVVILEPAKYDLKEIRDYIVKKFSRDAWLETSRKFREALDSISKLPLAGAVPEEIELLNLTQYTQIISGMNRIIYEVRQDVIFVHAVVDARRDMMSLLTKRLLRANR